MGLFEDTCAQIEGIDKELFLKIKKNWRNVAHPIESLGKLEELTQRIIAMTRDEDYKPDKRAWAIFCSDNGIVLEGTTLQTQDQTAIIVEEMLRGNCAAAVMAKFHNIDLFVVDMGLIRDIESPDIINKKIAYGSENFLEKPAMSRAEAIKAIESGIEIGDEFAKKGYNILMAGELGIGNTTTSAAILSALTGLSPKETVGRGAGIDDETLKHKVEVVGKGLELRKPDRLDALDVLSKVGGFDICAMTGFYLSCAKNRIPVILDGFISVVSALTAMRICEKSVEYFIPSHCSAEQGAIKTMEEMNMKAYLNLDMRLGEGTGCPLTLGIIEDAFNLYRNMYRFDTTELEKKYLVIGDE